MLFLLRIEQGDDESKLVSSRPFRALHIVEVLQADVHGASVEDRRFGDPEWRLRNGVGYRMNFNTRVEALYIWTTKKNSDTGRFATDSQAIDLRVKLAF